MEQWIVAFPSVTYANKGVNALTAAGLNAFVIRLDSSQTKGGCGFGTVVNGAQSEGEIKRILGRARVFYSEIFVPRLPYF